VNIGARVDGFDNDTRLFKNEWDPLDVITDENGDFVRYEPQRGDKVGFRWYFSPRVGVSHPVTDKLAMHYSFGRFFQYPNYSTIYTDYNFTDYAASPSRPTVRPDQDPVRSTNYELGAQWAIANDVLLTGTAYYRDVDKTQTLPVYLTTPENISLRFNNTWGYSDARGIEIELSKRPGKWWGGRISYTFSYIKRSGALSSDIPRSFSAVKDSSKYPRIPWDFYNQYPSREHNVLVTSGGTNTLAGGYDRPHRVNFTLQLFFPLDFNLNLIGEWTSGFYYQRFANVGNDPFFDRNLNLKVGPSTFFVNARLSKLFNFSNMGLELFIEGRNIFNRTNIRGISNYSQDRELEREIWELGRPDPSNPGQRLTAPESDPEGLLVMPTDVFGRLYYLNAQEWYVGLSFRIN